MKKKRGKRRLTQQPWFAGVMLLAGSVVAYGAFGGSASNHEGGYGNDVPMGLDEDDGDFVDGAGQGASAPGRDLVAEFGSYDGKGPVPALLAVLPQPQVDHLVPAAPGGETARKLGEWVGEAPPRLVVGVVFVGQGTRRAVVSGKVLGVGERIGDARIESIERGGLLVSWRNRLLTYDLDSPYPQEYRAEAAKRAAAQSNASAGEGDR